VIVITSVEELRLLALRPWLQLRAQRIQLALDHLASADKESWENRLARDLVDCGCRLGGTLLMIALVVVAGVALASPSLVRAAPVRTAGVAVAILVASAVVGKMIGLSLAQRRFRGSIAELARRVS
jgi:hypothetical protein